MRGQSAGVPASWMPWNAAGVHVVAAVGGQVHVPRGLQRLDDGFRGRILLQDRVTPRMSAILAASSSPLGNLPMPPELTVR